MTPPNRLGASQMCVCGNQYVRIPGAAFDESDLQGFDVRQNQADRLPDEQSEIGRDLVVAAAAGVQFQRGRADLAGQRRFDEGMDVFVRRRLDLLGSVLSEDLFQTLIDGLPLVIG